jgi:NAD(P)-dependent dehydrogenase (short-subunit alcohol dehydrogenase family)
MQREALITGGAGGLGSAIAEAMLADGYRVTVTGLTDDEVGKVPQRPGLRAVRLDVTDDDAVAATVASIEGVDALVNCAGMIARGGAEFAIDIFKAVLDVNLVGTMRVCTAAKEKLARRQGSIVNLASIMAAIGSPLVPAYSASKGGIVQLTKALAGAWAADGIRVNAISPGFIHTELTRPISDDQARSASVVARTPLRRWGEPSEVAGAVVFLCSDAARFVTGSVITIDGGYTAV